MLLNLTVNGVHAIEDQVENGKDHVANQVSFRTWYDDYMIMCSISDTGCGIPEAVSQKIFDHFFTTNDVGRGTGQGLSFVYDTITKHLGGSISVDSQLGQGTTFTLQFPRKKVDHHKQ